MKESLCKICMKPIEGDGCSHPSCLKRLFGTPQPLTIELSLTDIVAEAQKMAGRISISGVQPKLSMDRKEVLWPNQVE